MSKVQSILFNKGQWNHAEALIWQLTNGYDPMKLDITKHKLRYRQLDPKKFKYFATKDIGDGIQLVFGFNSKKKVHD